MGVFGDDVEEVTHVAESLERTRLTGDFESSKTLILSTASTFNGEGRELGPLHDEMSRATTGSREPSQAVRVVHRHVAVHGDAAIVTEIVGADLHAAGQRISPLRRTIVCVRGPDGWRIAHTHASPYSRWEPSIIAFETQDQTQPPPTGGIVFVGSSSVRGWRTLSEDFPNANAIGRGFGGSQLIDSILYAHRIVTPYKPRAVAIYAGDNDIASGATPERVSNDFRMLVETIHAELPETRIGFIAIKPSIKRWDMWPRMKSANQMIEQFAAQRELVDYLDIATPMLGVDGKPQPALFVKDGLHLTAAGYALWTEVVSPWANEN
jgi:lysophospholipase L1-like esterase